MPTGMPSPERRQKILLAAIDYMLVNWAPRGIVMNGQNQMELHFRQLKRRAIDLHLQGKKKQLERLFLQTLNDVRKVDGFDQWVRDNRIPDFSLDEIPEWSDPSVVEQSRTINHGNGIISKQVIISTGGGEPASFDDYSHKDLFDVLSPNGKNRVHVWESSYKDQVTTYVDLKIGLSGCGLYSTPGAGHRIRVYWKDENTVVLETPRGLQNINRRMGELRSGDDVVVIDYVEV